MKCPNCGKEMPKGSLYCEHCGEDIHVVPDFEPEMEQGLVQDIKSIMDEMQEESRTESRPESRAESRPGNRAAREKAAGEPAARRRPRRKGWLAAFIGVVLALAAGSVAWGVYSYHSVDYQADRGAYYTGLGQYDKALSCYGRALELDAGNVELMFRLAEVHLLRNNKIEYEYLLREIVRNPSASAEELESAYGRLIAVYAARGDYRTINDLLLASQNEAIWQKYQNYMARAPEFSVKEGYYTTIQPLKLTGYGTGKIYYTLDGSVPTVDSALYTAPIILENGVYVVSAYFVNDRGIASDVVTREYHIEKEVIPEPLVSAASGEYAAPVDIEVSGQPEAEIYYTTDGSDPTYSSTVYTGRIHMPLGSSVFRFVQIVDGVRGLVAERNYYLRLNTDLTVERAEAVIVDYCMGIGKILDREGHFDESGAFYRYRYQYVSNIGGVADCYVIAEFLCSADGGVARTGSNYAVNVYTGEYFRLGQDQYGNYSLIVIDNIETENSENEE